MSCSGSCHSHINLTTKGKLLLIDVERAKRDEFNRRRRLRLQQVRQQSNEIAREIRDKVRAEKHMRYSQEELKKQGHFDKWKEAQMKMLQDEFNRRALLAEQDKENAMKEAELIELEGERQRVLEDIAKKRGNLAVLKQRRDKLNVEKESFLKTSNAKFNRSLENLRSALVASLPKPETKKVCFDTKPSSERIFPSPSKIQKRNPDEIITDKLSEESEDFGSVMKIVSADSHQNRMEDTEQRRGWDPPSCSSNTYSSSYRSNTVSPDKFPRQKSLSSPDKRYFDDLPPSPRKSESVGWCHSLRDFDGPRRRPCSDRGEKSSLRSSISHPSSKQRTTISSPGKRVATTVLMSPSKRIAGSSQCSHSKDSSPVRCSESYSPNKYRDELDQGDANCLRSRHVRFKDNDSINRSDRFEHSLGRSRTVSEGESEVHSESDITWPPRNWNRNQEEEVILYNHCGRSTSKYQPKHTISIISDQENDDALEEELEACREKALRKHEEALRERRGCRALYRQRLRAEFSCMISDLSNLDKQTRLAKLETEAKAALFPRKFKKKPDTAINKDQLHVDKEDPPGSVQVMDCTDSINVQRSDKKFNTEVCRQEPMECNLDALDQLLTRLKEQRDHLLACQEVKDTLDSRVDKDVQSTSVQCSVPEKMDHSTSPRSSSPCKVTVRASPAKESRGTSPVELEKIDVTTYENLQREIGTSYSQTQELKTKTSTERRNDKVKVSDALTFSKDVAVSPLNISEPVVHSKVSDESSSGVSLDATSYSFDGVKVEVKVSKNKSKKTDKDKKTRKVYVKQPECEIANQTPKNDSWANKLAENNSSTGTSYMSPPDELNPEEHKVLISVLEGMDKKNSNPILSMYIQKLLSMSKGSLDNMSISVSEDSAMSEAFKSCYENIPEVNKKQNDSQVSSSYSTAYTHGRSLDENEKRVEGAEEEVRPVRRILESDDGSVINQDSVCTDVKVDRPYICPGPSTEYVDTLKQYNDRLKLLTKLMTEEKNTFRKSYSENDTSYLAIQSDLAVSVKLTESAQEVGLLKPDESCSEPSEEQLIEIAEVAATSWGVRSNILPKPDLFTEKRPKPPSTMNNYTSRGMIVETMPPHELSTIVEGDSKVLSSFQPYSSYQQSSSTEKKCMTTKSSVSPKEAKLSEEESFKTLPPTGFPASSETSMISSGNISPVKKGDESSLHIFTELPDSSFGQSSAEEVAVSEVFRSLGIGWALSTWRKTHEASRKIEESSSSSLSDTVGQGKKKLEEMRCRHSTPIKAGESDAILKITESDDNHLTPPTVSLYERYQNLIRSASVSSSNDS